ncbi:hypothetical protein TNCV_4436871 [Trichonephila clavipes]|nr:hypothetical protein TNCV_4436871 [Trichonephila clavipes]
MDKLLFSEKDQVARDTTLGVPIHHHAHVTSLNPTRRMDRGVVVLEHRLLSPKECLNQRLEMIYGNALLMVACDEDNESLQFG